MASLLQGLIVLHLFQTYVCSCYFPVELQGEFLMQSVMTGSNVQYSKVNITSEAIPIWGSCHRHIGNNVLLIDSLNGGSCIRCFSLKLRSKNILQVQTEGLDKCYTSEEAAEATCPSEDSLNNNKEIILYKTKGIDEENITKAYCPINGKFKFTYSINDGSEQKMECSNPTSLLDGCTVPEESGSALNLRFQGCSFEDHDTKYDCLGDWEGPDNQRYLALMDTRLHGEQRPQYRCAMYKEDKETGTVFMALASDSTCTTDLHSAISGFETYNFTSEGFGEWPDLFEPACRFPIWSIGEWENLQVDSEYITYRDHPNFQTLTMRCDLSEIISNNISYSEERFLVLSKSACGEAKYTCIWLKRRSMNVLEFQLGAITSKDFNTWLCSDSNFVDRNWKTQGRLEGLYESPCPVMGDYTGFIPNKMQLCAKLSSDERSPEIMYYTVSDCRALEEIYEERQYRCLGQWDEGELTYTYTQRKDVGTYECFVGKIVSNNELYIKEAGEHCDRGVDALILGMKLTRKGDLTHETTSNFDPFSTSSTWLTTSKRPSSPTKPWKPITAPPRQNGGTRSAQGLLSIVFFASMVCGLQFFLNLRRIQKYWC